MGENCLSGSVVKCPVDCDGKRPWILDDLEMIA